MKYDRAFWTFLILLLAIPLGMVLWLISAMTWGIG